MQDENFDLDWPLGFSDIEIIGSGGMSNVYKARYQGRLVAVKVPVSRYEKRQILRDAKVLKSLDHKHIAKFFEVLETSRGHLLLIMEFLGGGSLRDRIDQFRDPQQAVDLIGALADAVQYLHDLNFLHRDLKPENVLFDENQSPKVIDLGLLKPIVGVDDTRETIGTQAYASPELLGRVDVDQLTGKSDVFSLGLMFVELLTGSLPTASDWRPGRGNRLVHGATDQVALACLQEDPALRPTASTLKKWLHESMIGKFPEISPGRPNYPRVMLGEHTLTLVRIVGGDGRNKYEFPSGIQVRESGNFFQVPDEILEVTEDWLKARLVTREEGTPFANNDQPRLEDVGFGLTDDASERLHPLVLKVGKTKYFDMQVTNHCINFLLPDRSSVRNKYGGRITDLGGSQLANPLAVNLSIVTSDNFICVAERGTKVGTNPVFDSDNRIRFPAVSGTGHPLYDRDSSGKFCVFHAARREAEEEVFGKGNVALEEIVFFGVGRTTYYFFPFLFGEIHTNLSFDKLQSRQAEHVNDVVKVHGRPLTIPDVTDWINYLAGRPKSNTAVWSLYQSLIYRFPNQIDEINSLLKA
jgi:serine/threonine protein kinase